MEKDFEREVLDRLKTIEIKMDDYMKVRKDSSQALNLSKENEKDITEIEEKIKWLERTVIGAIITGAIGVLFYFIKI